MLLRWGTPMANWSKDDLQSALENKDWSPTCRDIQDDVQFKLAQAQSSTFIIPGEPGSKGLSPLLNPRLKHS